MIPNVTFSVFRRNVLSTSEVSIDNTVQVGSGQIATPAIFIPFGAIAKAGLYTAVFVLTLSTNRWNGLSDSVASLGIIYIIYAASDNNIYPHKGIHCHLNAECSYISGWT